MLRDGQKIGEAAASALLTELDAYCLNHPRGGKRLSDAAVAGQIGISSSTLSELRRGTYKGDVQRQLRLIDEFLGKERSREGRFDVRAYSPIGTAQRMAGVTYAAIRGCSVGAIIADPGAGKTLFLRAFAADREGAVLITIDGAHADDRGLSALLAKEFKLNAVVPHRERAEAIVGYLQRTRNLVLLVDECQQLKVSGLEFLRSVHDQSDPEGRRCLPIVLAGDSSFLRLIVKARAGEPGPIRPQLSRRIYPLLHLESDVMEDGDGNLFTVEDIRQILRSNRVKLVTEAGAKWLAALANARGWGALGTAMATVSMALDITQETPVDVPTLQAALRMMIGPRAVETVDDLAGGRLLSAAG